MQTTFFVEFRFWVKDLEVRCYNNHLSRNEVKDMIIDKYDSMEFQNI